jgi:hypothetical protein
MLTLGKVRSITSISSMKQGHILRGKKRSNKGFICHVLIPPLPFFLQPTARGQLCEYISILQAYVASPVVLVALPPPPSPSLGDKITPGGG